MTIPVPSGFCNCSSDRNASGQVDAAIRAASSCSRSAVEFLEDFNGHGSTRLTRVRLLNLKDAEAGNFPTATVTDPMFRPVSQNGFGLNKSEWFWSRGNPAYDETCGG